MPAAKEETTPKVEQPSEEERIWKWKFDCLMRAGFPFEDSELLAEVPDVMAKVRPLIARGWKHDAIVRVIL